MLRVLLHHFYGLITSTYSIGKRRLVVVDPRSKAATCSLLSNFAVAILVLSAIVFVVCTRPHSGGSEVTHCISFCHCSLLIRSACIVYNACPSGLLFGEHMLRKNATLSRRTRRAAVKPLPSGCVCAFFLPLLALLCCRSKEFSARDACSNLRGDYKHPRSAQTPCGDNPAPNIRARRHSSMAAGQLMVGPGGLQLARGTNVDLHPPRLARCRQPLAAFSRRQGGWLPSDH